MYEPAAYWALALLPTVPFFLVYFAFRNVLDSKKFEIEMLLDRGESLTNYLAAYGGSSEGPEGGAGEPRRYQIERIVGQVFRLHYPGSGYVWALTFSSIAVVLLVALAFSFAGLPLGLPM